MSLIFSELAERELIDSFNWYENKEVGLGSVFLKTIKEEVNWVEIHPLKTACISESAIRCKIVHTFPFNIYYEFDESNHQITILAIAHQKREPKYWIDKI